MAYAEATWPKVVNLQTAVERLERQFEAISWDAMLNLNKLTLSAEDRKDLEAVEKRYFEAMEQCNKFLQHTGDINSLKQYLVDVGLENYVSSFEKFVK